MEYGEQEKGATQFCLNISLDLLAQLSPRLGQEVTLLRI